MNLDRIIAVRNDKTVYRDGDNCIKVFGNSYSKANILKEALNRAWIEETDLPVPSTREITTVDGKWAIVSDFICGKTLAQIMEEDPDNKDAYMERFVRLQLEVNSHVCSNLIKLNEKMHNKICDSGLDATTRYDLHLRVDGLEQGKQICHGDFNPSNIIITEDDRAFIIDWAHVTQGDPAADAARTYLCFWLDGDIDGAEKYLELYCALGDTAKQHVQKWMPIVAASQLIKGNRQEREFLLTWISVVEYR